MIVFKRKFFDGNPSLSRIKEEISMQITLKLQLEKTIPETITIGLFVIHIESLKHVLIRKRIDLADLTMKTHASLTTEKIEICCAEYNRMYLRLFEIPTSIEQVFEIKKWIDTSPMLISKQSEIVRRLFEVILYYIYTNHKCITPILFVNLLFIIGYGNVGCIFMDIR